MDTLGHKSFRRVDRRRGAAPERREVPRRAQTLTPQPQVRPSSAEFLGDVTDQGFVIHAKGAQDNQG